MKGKKKEKDKNRRYAIIFVVAFASLLISPLLLSVYAGGWNVQVFSDKMVLDGEVFDMAGLKTATYETDANFATGDDWPDNGEIYGKPGITVEHSGAFYVAPVGNTWVEDDEPYIVDTYDVEYTDEHFARYNQYAIGYDVTIKTDAGEYYKQSPIPFVRWGYIDYGWYYEDASVKADVFTTFKINPWTATGQNENWDVVNGWSGIMSAQVGEVEFGLIQEVDAEGDIVEDRGHIIQNLNSKGSQLNMYISGVPEEDYDFNDPAGLVGVPSTVQVETTGTLGAGASLGLDLANHVWDIAVRNVYVKYRVIVHVLTSLEYEFRLGDQGGMEKPEEDNTEHTPQIAVLDLLGNIFDEYEALIYLVIIAIIGLAGVYILIQMKPFLMAAKRVVS